MKRNWALNAEAMAFCTRARRLPQVDSGGTELPHSGVVFSLNGFQQFLWFQWTLPWKVRLNRISEVTTGMIFFARRILMMTLSRFSHARSNSRQKAIGKQVLLTQKISIHSKIVLTIGQMEQRTRFVLACWIQFEHSLAIWIDMNNLHTPTLHCQMQVREVSDDSEKI